MQKNDHISWKVNLTKHVEVLFSQESLIKYYVPLSQITKGLRLRHMNLNRLNWGFGMKATAEKVGLSVANLQVGDTRNSKLRLCKQFFFP